jgi:hypothetical protein
MHPGSNKMYHDLRSLYWWTRMKREIAKYISECDTCQRVKASHLKVADTLQPLPIPSWKWEDICMDFIVGLPNTSQHHDSIWVIVDRLTKTAHFLPVHTTHKTEKYAEIYIDQIVRLHGIPKTIVSDRGALFVARFWEHLQESLGTRAIRSSTYHPQTDGQTERVSAFRPRGVPGPTSKLSPRVPAQMGQRETEHEGGRGDRQKGETRGLRVVLRPGRVRLQ